MKQVGKSGDSKYKLHSHLLCFWYAVKNPTHWECCNCLEGSLGLLGAKLYISVPILGN